MLTNKLMGASAPTKTYIEDVFSTYLYTGNGSTQTINNGIDLAGKGGMVWTKSRSALAEHGLFDTGRGAKYLLRSNSTSQSISVIDSLTSFNNNGFSVGSDVTSLTVNQSGKTYASWTFRKAPKFFDVVTYTGNGVARTINHSLSTAPGMIIVKLVDGSSNWAVYHRSQTSASYYTKLNLPSAQESDSTVWNGTEPTDSVFSVGTSSLTNFNGSSYVAYLFAHDTTTDGLIQCGLFTGTGSSVPVNLGWEPQYLLVKKIDSISNWYVWDTMRGWDASGNLKDLYANTTDAETANSGLSITATGFSTIFTGSYIYMAIRRGPMKTPTDGTKVFQPVARAGTGAATEVTSGFVTDLTILRNRGSVVNNNLTFDRLRSVNGIYTHSTSEEVAQPTTIIQANPWDSMTGLKIGSTNTGVNASGNSYINWMFRRAAGFFDVVCYTGTGAARTVNHNLGVAPELIIVKKRSATDNWGVYSAPLGNTKCLFLDSTMVPDTSSGYWNATSPTSSDFSVATVTTTNQSGATYVAYLFASCPGVSKVGSYVGNGTSQNINCGFTNGARFVLIKRTDSTGDWYVWDTARGIVAGNDPRLRLNSTAAEVTTDDTIDPDSTGFIVNQVAATNVNVSGGSYIYLAIA